MKQRIFLLALLATAFNAATASADLIIAVGNAQVTQGDTATVDVTIASNNPNVDTLSAANFQFLIQPVGTSSGLQFISPQPDGQLTDSSYVFAGNSADVMGTPPSRVGNVTTTTTTRDTFTGGDSTNDGTGVPLSKTFLLARLAFSTDNVSPFSINTFTVSLLLNAFTSFQDGAFSPLNVASPTPEGTVTVNVRAVPEPASFALFGAGSLLCLGLRRRRKQRSL